MDELKWEILTEVQGRMEAELIESFLEAHGVDTELVQESVGHSIYPVTINGLGRVQIFTPKSESQVAHDLLREYQQGNRQEE